jgi:hypothetical protein
LWQHHFGRGIVATPSDFGAQGDKPAHPELLDFLAAELVHAGLALEADAPPHAHERCLHAERRVGRAAQRDRSRQHARVAAEKGSGSKARSSATRSSPSPGALDATMFGAGTLDAGMKRRSIYFQIKRSQLPPMLITFDGPDTLNGLGLRAQTTVAPQALLLMNNKLIRSAALDWAKAFAPPRARGRRNARISPRSRVRRPTAKSRPPPIFCARKKCPTKAPPSPDAAHLALADFCQAVLSMNEFVYVE